jgi:hypothetical protein
VSDPERARRLNAQRQARFRARRDAYNEWAAEITAGRVARRCDRLETAWPEQVAWLIQHVPPEVAGEVVDELLRRDQDRAGGGGG